MDLRGEGPNDSTQDDLRPEMIVRPPKRDPTVRSWIGNSSVAERGKSAKEAIYFSGPKEAITKKKLPFLPPTRRWRAARARSREWGRVSRRSGSGGSPRQDSLEI